MNNRLILFFRDSTPAPAGSSGVVSASRLFFFIREVEPQGLLQENGDSLLQESHDFILLEASSGLEIGGTSESFLVVGPTPSKVLLIFSTSGSVSNVVGEATEIETIDGTSDAVLALGLDPDKIKLVLIAGTSDSTLDTDFDAVKITGIGGTSASMGILTSVPNAYWILAGTLNSVLTLTPTGGAIRPVTSTSDATLATVFGADSIRLVIPSATDNSVLTVTAGATAIRLVSGTSDATFTLYDGFVAAYQDLPSRFIVRAPSATVTYNEDSEWNDWSGFRRVSGNVMRLAFQNMANVPGLNIDNQVFHYRWGTLQSQANTPDNGRDAVLAATNANTMGLIPNGLQADLSGVGLAYVELPGATGEYQYLYEFAPSAPIPPAPPGVVDSFIFATWIETVDAYSRTLFGGTFHQDAEDPDEESVASAVIEVSDTGDELIFIASLHTRDFPANEATFYTELTVPKTAPLNHLLLHEFFTRSDTETWWYARWFINGLFMKETKARLDDAVVQDYANTQTASVQATMLTSKKPVLFASKESIAPFDGGYPWGHDNIVSQFNGYMDETMFAKCHPILNTDSTPKVSHSWSVGDTIFPATRHPNPVALGINAPEFIMRSPVTQTWIGHGGAITRVAVYFNSPTPAGGQAVAVSVRASDTLFDQDSTLLPWSDWRAIDVEESTDQVAVHGGGHGTYVQMRIRLLPSTDMTVSPQVSVATWYAEWDDNTSSSQDLPSRVFVNPYQDLPSRIVVLRTNSQDLPSRVVVCYPGTPQLLPSRIYVRQPVAHDLPSRIFQSLYHQDLPSRFNVVSNDNSEFQDLPSKINIVPTYQDLPSRIVIPGRQDLPSRLFVTINSLPSRIFIQKAAYQDLSSRVVIVPELPGDVEPITASVPEATWVNTPVVTFSWESSAWTRLPVVAYYWTLTQNPTLQPDTTWSDQGLTGVTVDFSSDSYGGGQWYFKVAARNSAGYFGPAASFAVWFNDPPATPGQSFMTASGFDTLVQVPLVGSRPGPRLRWNPSQDLNDDVITYQVQVASRPDFGPDGFGNTSVAVSQESINTNAWVLTPVPNPGKWFWRVRASDGRQSSNWSPVGAFRLNAPPTRPGALSAAQV